MIPENFQRFFLLQFTNELIKHSRGEIFELESILKKNEERIKEEAKDRTKEEVKEKIREKEKEEKEIIEKTKPLIDIKIKQFDEKDKLVPSFSFENKNDFSKPFRPFVRKAPLKSLRIPEPKFPPRLQYLKPIPVKVDLDLGKLNVLVKDPMVRIIECNGPDENIIVESNLGIKKTSIILNEEEIDEIINKFSEAAKIPVSEGVFRVVFGEFVFLAVISGVVSSKFVIRKMRYNSRSF
ncbi:MAG: hypothetical protein ABH811_02155 [archaeon]